MSMDTIEVVTVGQLKEVLDGFDDDTPVGIGYQYGDHWRSTGVVVPIMAEEKAVKWSANLSTIIVDERDESDDVWVILED